MAENTAVNSQVTDSVTQVNTHTLGNTPAVATGNLYQAMSYALGLAALNSSNAQQQSNMTAQASGTMGITTLFAIDTAADAISVSEIIDQVPK